MYFFDAANVFLCDAANVFFMTGNRQLMCCSLNDFFVMEQRYFVLGSKCILCDGKNEFVWCSKCILCDGKNVFVVMQQMYFVLTGNWCIVPRMPLTAVFGRQPHSSGGEKKKEWRTSRECIGGMIMMIVSTKRRKLVKFIATLFYLFRLWKCSGGKEKGMKNKTSVLLCESYY